MTPNERRGRAFRARAALDDGALKEAFEEVERDLHAEWAGSMFQRNRERAWHELKALQRVRSKLASMAGQAPRD